MAKRFTSTDIWGEDWFLDMPNEYKLFWYYMLSHCNHAGLFKVNLRSFCGLLEVNLTPKQTLEFFNNGKIRIREINPSLWLVEEFFMYQYGNILNMGNRVHASIATEYKKHKIELTSIRGLNEVKQGVKDKDKDIDKDIISKEVIQIQEIDVFVENKNAIIPKMVKAWKKHHPDYFEDLEKDSKSLLMILKTISTSLNVSANILNLTPVETEQIITRWSNLAKFISTHNHFKNYALNMVEKHLQSILKSETNGTQSSNGSTNHNGSGLSGNAVIEQGKKFVSKF
jgi:hypothetical protein